MIYLESIPMDAAVIRSQDKLFRYGVKDRPTLNFVRGVAEAIAKYILLAWRHASEWR